jgi:hypothetical protein
MPDPRVDIDTQCIKSGKIQNGGSWCFGNDSKYLPNFTASIEGVGVPSNDIDSYSEGAQFESRLGCLLFRMRLVAIVLSPFKQMPG